jgi:hypothetical protein
LTILKRDTKENEQWRETKKLGSLLVDNEDVTNRKHLAIAVIFNFGMTLNIEKCLIGKTEIPWWGIIISSEGIKPDQREKVRALQHATAPRSKDKVRSFLCMIPTKISYQTYQTQTPHKETLKIPLGQKAPIRI